jgi:hypothetical protein
MKIARATGLGISGLMAHALPENKNASRFGEAFSFQPI